MIEAHTAPDKLMATTQAFIKQLANYDAVEGCYELHIPFPASVKVDVVGKDNWMEVSQEMHALMDGFESMTYNNIGLAAGTVHPGMAMVMRGIAWSTAAATA